MSLLPTWTFLLGLMALFGYMAIAAGINVAEPNLTGPALLRDMFPSWFFGVACAAIAIGALVPAAVMSIAAANLFAVSQDYTPVWDTLSLVFGRRWRGDAVDETKPEDYDELHETHEPAPTVGAGVA